MTKNYSYTFSINKPCSESWYNMPASEKGRFCMNCQKEVVDFSNMTDDQIVEVLLHKEGSTCGRLKKNQLNRPMQLSQYFKRPSSVRTILAGVAILSLITPLIMEASSSLPEKKVYPITIAENKRLPDDSAYLYRGRLVDKTDTSAAIPDVSIYIANSSVEVLSDSLGRFEFFVPETLRTKSFTLTLSSMGYQSVNILVNPLKTDFTTEHLFMLTESESQYMKGDIQIIQEVK